MRRTLLFATLVLLAALVFAPTASAEPTGCIGPDPHKQPDCTPYADPHCIYWYFGLGDARVCTDEWLP